MNREEWIRNRAYVLWLFRRDLGLGNDTVRNWLDAEWEYDKFYAPHLKFFIDEKILKQ